MGRRAVIIPALILWGVTLPIVARAGEQADRLDAAAAALEDWNTSPSERETALATLRHARLGAVDRVRQLLASRVWETRRDALTLASQIGAPDFDQHLAAAAGDENWSVRERVASLAAGLNTEAREALRPAVEKLTADRIPAVRLAAYQTLLQWDNKTSFLDAALSDGDRDVAYWAAQRYMERARSEQIPPEVKARLVDNVVNAFRSSDWSNLGYVSALFTLGETAQDALYEAVSAESGDMRRQAIGAIGSAAGAGGVDLMFRFINDTDQQVRQVAMSSIAQYCTDRHVPELLRILNSPSDLAMRQMAANAVGRLRCKEAVPRLMELAGNSDRQTRQVAFRALVQIDDPDLRLRAMQLYRRETDINLRAQMIEPLARLLKEDAAEFLEETVHDANPSVRTYAVRALGASRINREKRTALLLDVIRDEHLDGIRGSAMDALGSEGSDEVVEALVAVLGEGGPMARRSAINALSRLKSPRAAEAIIGSFEDEQDPQVRQLILGALGQMNDKRAIPVLRKAMESDDPQVRAVALNALARMGDALDNDYLIELLSKEDNDQVLQICIAQIGSRRIRAPGLLKHLSKHLDSPELGLRWAVVNCIIHVEGELAATTLCDVIQKETEASVRNAAVQELVKRLSHKTVSAAAMAAKLAETMQTTDPEARLAIVRAVGMTGASEFAPILLETLKSDTSDVVRLAAARVIKPIASSDMVPQFIEAAKAEESEPVVVALIDILGQLADPMALPFIQENLRSAKPAVQAAAMNVIGSFKDASLVPFYVDRLTRSTSVEVRVTSLRNIKGSADRRAFGALLQALKDNDPRIRRAALEALVDFVDPDAVAAIAPLIFEDGADTESIMDLLGRARMTSTVDMLLDATKNGKDARGRIYTALGRLGDRRAVPMLTKEVSTGSDEDLAGEAIGALVALDAQEQASLCLDRARSSVGRLSFAAADAAVRLGAGALAEPFLIERFAHGTEREKALCARLLAAAGGENVDDVLASELERTSDPSLAAEVCPYLVPRLPKSTAIVRHILLGDDDGQDIVAVIHSLEGAAGHETEQALERIVNSARPAQVRAAALVELVRMRLNDPDATRMILEHIGSPEPDLRRAAARAAGMWSAGAVPELADALIQLTQTTEDTRLKAEAVKSLGSVGKGSDAVIDALLKATEDETDVKADAIRSLGRLRAAGAVPRLVELAGAGSNTVRIAAVEALGAIGTGPAIDAVERAFGQEHVDGVRAAAARALGRTGRAGYAPRLIEVLNSAPGLDVRAACAEALGGTGGQDGIQALTAALKHESGLVRESSVRALGELGAVAARDEIARMVDDTDLRVAAAAEAVLAGMEQEK